MDFVQFLQERVDVRELSQEAKKALRGKVKSYDRVSEYQGEHEFDVELSTNRIIVTLSDVKEIRGEVTYDVQDILVYVKEEPKEVLLPDFRALVKKHEDVFLDMAQDIIDGKRPLVRKY